MANDTLPNQMANGQPHDAVKILGNDNFTNDKFDDTAGHKHNGVGKGRKISRDGIDDDFYAYGQAYRSTIYDMAVSNTWYVIGFVSPLPISKNITLGSFTPAGSGETTNNKLTVTYAGVYRIKYHINFRGDNTGVGHCVSRIRINDTTEIAGSWGQADFQNSQNYNLCFTEQEVIVSLAINDAISIQVGRAVADADVNYFDDVNLPDATTYITAIVIIERIDD